MSPDLLRNRLMVPTCGQWVRNPFRSERPGVCYALRYALYVPQPPRGRSKALETMAMISAVASGVTGVLNGTRFNLRP